MKITESICSCFLTGTMITERKALGTIDSNVTRVQPTRAAKTGHKWFANRQQKTDQDGVTKVPQHRTYLQHLALQHSQKQAASTKENQENRAQTYLSHVEVDSIHNFRPNGKNSNMNKNCPFRVPLQTLPFGNISNSIQNCLVDQKEHKPAFFLPVLDEQIASISTSDSDVSLRSIPDDDLSESFLNKSQSGKKSRNVSQGSISAPSKPTSELDLIEEYLPDILSHLRASERKFKPKENYLDKQAEVTSVMRVKLTDWLIEVQDEYKLRNETLYLAVAFVDRFLSEMSVSRAKLQLLGTSSMFLAAKIEEIYPPDASEFAYVTADTYTRNEVLLMERMILNVFKCTLTMPTPYQFLTVFMEKSSLDKNARNLACYLSEMALLDEKYLRYIPSVKAAAALTLAILTARYARYCDLANGNIDSQDSYESCSMNVENESQKSTFNSNDPVICSMIKTVMFSSVKEIYQCVSDLANSHVQESNSTHFLREKYSNSSQGGAAKITPLLADSTMDPSCFLTLENIQQIWLP